VHSEDGWKFARKIAVLDSRQIDTLGDPDLSRDFRLGDTGAPV